MITLILGLLDTGLKLWLSKEKTKYIDKKIALEKAYWEEINRPEGEINDAALVNIEFELRILAIAFISEASKV